MQTGGKALFLAAIVALCVQARGATILDIVPEASNEAYLPFDEAAVEIALDAEEEAPSPDTIIEEVAVIEDEPVVEVIEPVASESLEVAKAELKQENLELQERLANLEQQLKSLADKPKRKKKTVIAPLALAEQEVAAAPMQVSAPILPSAVVPDESPFGVMVRDVGSPATKPSRIVNRVELEDAVEKRSEIMFSQASPRAGANPFVKSFSAIKPETKAEKSPKSVKSGNAARGARKLKKRGENVVSFASPAVLKSDLRREYLADNKFLAPLREPDEEEEFEDEEEYEEEEFDEAEDEAVLDTVPAPAAAAGASPTLEPAGVSMDAVKDKMQKTLKTIELPAGALKVGSHEVLQMKLDFDQQSSAISSESVNIIRSFAQIATDMPTNSIEIGLSESVMKNPAKKRLAARRLAIVSNVLRSAGLAEKQIFPVLTDRDENSFSFRVVTNDRFEQYRVVKGADEFGDGASVTVYDLMRW